MCTSDIIMLGLSMGAIIATSVTFSMWYGRRKSIKNNDNQVITVD